MFKAGVTVPDRSRATFQSVTARSPKCFNCVGRRIGGARAVTGVNDKYSRRKDGQRPIDSSHQELTSGRLGAQIRTAVKTDKYGGITLDEYLKMADNSAKGPKSSSKGSRNAKKKGKAAAQDLRDEDLPASIKKDLRRAGRGGADARANAADCRVAKRSLEADLRAGGRRAEAVRGCEEEQDMAAKRAKKYAGRQDPTTR